MGVWVEVVVTIGDSSIIPIPLTHPCEPTLSPSGIHVMNASVTDFCLIIEARVKK